VPRTLERRAGCDAAMPTAMPARESRQRTRPRMINSRPFQSGRSPEGAPNESPVHAELKFQYVFHEGRGDGTGIDQRTIARVHLAGQKSPLSDPRSGDGSGLLRGQIQIDPSERRSQGVTLMRTRIVVVPTIRLSAPERDGAVVFQRMLTDGSSAWVPESSMVVVFAGAVGCPDYAECLSQKKSRPQRGRRWAIMAYSACNGPRR